MSNEIAKLRQLVRDVPDFPKPGIIFKDITPLIGDAAGLVATIDLLSRPFEGAKVTAVAGMESRGFIFGVPVAMKLGVGFVPIRKPGKLPAAKVSEEYALEYGTDRLEMHRDAVKAGDLVLVVDDLLATGGTAAATVRMIESLGARVVGACFAIELGFLGGREKLSNIDVHSLIRY